MTETLGVIGSAALCLQEERRIYDLEGRTEAFARNIRRFVRKLRPTFIDRDDFRQLVRASGSIGANYIEANDALSKKDFLMRAKICRKEAKESAYWLRLLDVEKERDREKESLHDEAMQLMKIFGAIVRKCE
jgi:four helix bundle protein